MAKKKSKPISELNDEALVEELKKKLNKKNIINLDEYFDNPEIDSYFQEIYGRYKLPIERYCGKFIFDKDLKTDIFHDIFIKIYLNIHKFHYSKSFKSWVYKIAHNSCINYQRKNKNKEFYILNKKISGKDGGGDFELIDMFQDQAPGQEKIFINGEIKEIIDKAVERLPSEYANVFLLKTEGGLTFEEVAKILKISSRSVKSFYRNATIFIKEELIKNNISLEGL